MNLVRMVLVTFIGTIIIMVLFYFPTRPSVGRALLLIQSGTFAIGLCLWRYFFSKTLLTSRLFKRVLIVGAGKAGRRILQIIRENPRCGFSPVGFLDDDPAKLGMEIDGLPMLGDSTGLDSMVEKYNISLVIVAITHRKTNEIINRLIRVCWKKCNLTDVASVYEIITAKIPTNHISAEWLFQWNLNSTKRYYKRIKRIFDLLQATIIFIVSLPLLIVIPLAIKVSSRGPVLFKQERLGLDRKSFFIYKFRTMIHNPKVAGNSWTEENDPRVTPVGKYLRKLRLDELPQLFNILKGDMSFIGPRPLVHSDRNENITYYNYRFLVRPGLTGWAQVTFPEGLSIETTEEKIKYDLYYIKNIGLLLDMAILLKTAKIIMFGKAH